jgi:regulator of protease activity HflC (stomatin/prohibitin superfamily)
VNDTTLFGGVFGLVLIGIIAIGLPMSSCERVDVGHVGIRINKAGSERGAEHIPTVSGYVWFNPFTTAILEYPVFMQTARWERSGDNAGEEICFNSKEGLVLCADVSLSFQLTPAKVPQFYSTFRTDDIDKFTHGYLRNIVKDSLDAAASEFTAEQILGEKKEALTAATRKRVGEATGGIGVDVQQLGFLNPPRPPKSVTDAINTKIAAIQNSTRVQNDLVTAKAEADKVAADADGKRRAMIADAQGRAESRRLAAEADANANKALAGSLSPQLLDWQRLEIERQAIAKWNGARPMIEGSSNGLQLLMQTPVKP